MVEPLSSNFGVFTVKLVAVQTFSNFTLKSIILKCLFILYEPRCEKTGLLGFRRGPTQTGLYN